MRKSCSPTSSQAWRGKFSVQAVPTLLILNQGNVLSRQSGAAPPDVLLRWVDEALQKKADSAGAAR